ncbi:MAG: LytTR family transcriptional regulator [Cytophagaceae bacterium]|nr:LytTR family transcriptional regulator [Cytophagaceae bacterium]
MNLPNILRQPFPHGFGSTRRAVFTALGAGVFIWLFLVFFQPFDINLWKDPNKPWYLLGYGLVTFLSMLLLWIVLPKIVPGWFSEAHWTVGKQILSVLATVLLVALGNIFYSHWAFGQPLNLQGILGFIYVTTAVGLFPAVGITYINYVRNLRRYSQPPQPIPLTSTEKIADETQRIELLAENEKDKLNLPLADLLYIESADNYSEVVFLRNDQVKKELLRGSLSRFEGQVPPAVVVRCHRSYLVNLHRVQRVSGNAQGYKFHLTGLETPVPVARKYSEVVSRFR